MRKALLSFIDHDWRLMIVIAMALIVSSAFTCIERTSARSRAMLPVEEWTPATQLWLSRAMVGEAGWKSELDHVAIAYVLERRWRQMRRRWPALRFRHVVLSYSKVLGTGRRELTKRQIWVRGLLPGEKEPVGWPVKASWKTHLPLWKAIWQRSANWQQGKLADPCEGRASHWGGEIDEPWEGLMEVDCGDTANTFYGVDVSF